MGSRGRTLPWIVAGLGAVLLGGCTRLACGTDAVKAEEISPDGRWVAGVLERNCGATTQYGDYVAIRRRDQAWDTDALDRAVLLVVDQIPITAFWKSDDELVVRTPRAAVDKVVHRANDYQGIRIKHVVEAAVDPDVPVTPAAPRR
jgi:hypothetical protein